MDAVSLPSSIARRAEAPSPTGPRATPPAVRQAARRLETAFAAEMLKSARPAPKEDGLFGGGIGARSFDTFMNEALGEAMMTRGGLGLSRALEGAILGAQRSSTGTQNSHDVAAPAVTP